MEGIEYRQRVFVVGQTRSGKSELLNHLFSEVRCQRLLLDTKGGEWTIEGVEPVSDPDAIDWREPIIHYVTPTDDLDEIERLFSICCRRRNLCVCVHELGDLCGFNANRTPPSVSAFISKGGAHGRGLFAGSQRPVEMPVRASSEAQHVFVMTPRMMDRDLKAIANLGIGTEHWELGRMVDEAEEAHGPYSFIWFPKGARAEVTVWEPLPEHVRAGIIVRRAEGVM